MSIEMCMCKRCGSFFIPKMEKVFMRQENDKLYFYCCYECWKKDGGEDGRKYI